MSNLSETINEFMTPRVFERVSAASGLPDAKVRVGMNGAVASILDGLVNKAHDPRTMGQITDLVRTTPSVDMPERVLDDEVTVQRNSDHLLGLVGGDTQSLVTRVGRFVGVGGKAASGMVAAAAAVVIGAVRKLTQAPGGFDASALSTRLIDEGRAIHAAVPPGMLATGQERLAAARTERSAFDTRGTLERRHGAERPLATERPWWLLGLLGLAALIAVIWVTGRSRHNVSTPAIHTPKVTEHQGVTPTAPATPTRPTEPTAPSATTGAGALSFPAGTPAAQLLSEVRAPSAPGAGKWIDLDANFETGQAVIAETARDQIANVASVLSAYPDTKVKIAGYSDPSGTPNVALAQQRADALRDALVARGIDGSRIETAANREAAPGESGEANRHAAIQVTGR